MNIIYYHHIEGVADVVVGDVVVVGAEGFEESLKVLFWCEGFHLLEDVQVGLGLVFEVFLVDEFGVELCMG
jgi:hypothetical protein